MKKAFILIIFILTTISLFGFNSLKKLNDDEALDMVSNNLNNRYSLINELDEDYNKGKINEKEFYNREMSIYENEMKNYSKKSLKNIKDNNLKSAIVQVSQGLEFQIKSTEFAMKGDYEQTMLYHEEAFKIGYSAIMKLKNNYNVNLTDEYINHIEETMKIYNKNK
ncbi:hypothetical protein [Clostridium sp. CCUG 7971]|uniref:hypothetical protein n=1 Tax=Clostridium sp. CCUG 7971 TaxID=2811414 RepID=UPI001ABB2C38|nr:hypothetical protein [Clostridium sp. CCUG 7971]MBO3446041.1 hypothetical protein [Clostridium sp. CCUG 7971]